ncbi:hypothetical protein ACFWNK_34385 [Streptomyces sp. NPDC058417]|uniref:hypothetical protein n=1 Tax=unclassified Streptomyces TaxID=2593676 RepID=UPI003646BF13
MRVRVASTALGLTAVLLALPACSTGTPQDERSATTRAAEPSERAHETVLLSSAALESRLLNQSDLGSRYRPKPQHPARHEDVSVLGCPALNELSGDAATGATLTFPRKAKVAFTYGNSSSEISEELYSDSAKKLSDGISQVFDALTGCPTYQILAGGAPVDVASQKLAAPRHLGDEQWSQLLTFSTGGRSTVVKQTAIRDDSLLVIVSGSPALVDRHLRTAVAKGTLTG